MTLNYICDRFPRAYLMVSRKAYLAMGPLKVGAPIPCKTGVGKYPSFC